MTLLFHIWEICEAAVENSTIFNKQIINGVLIICEGKKCVCVITFLPNDSTPLSNKHYELCRALSPFPPLNFWILYFHKGVWIKNKKKTAAAAAVQQFRENTSCTFSPALLYPRRTKSKIIRQLKQGSCLFTYDSVDCCCWHSAHTLLEIRSVMHRSHGDSSHIIHTRRRWKAINDRISIEKLLQLLLLTFCFVEKTTKCC